MFTVKARKNCNVDGNEDSTAILTYTSLHQATPVDECRECVIEFYAKYLYIRRPAFPVGYSSALKLDQMTFFKPMRQATDIEDL